MKYSYNYMKYYKTLSLTVIVILASIILFNCQSNRAGKQSADNLFTIKIHNSSDILQNDVLVQLNRSDLSKEGLDYDFDKLIVFSGEKEIPSQISNSQLYFMIDQINPDESKQINLRVGEPSFNYPKRTQAEISVKKGGHFEDRKYIGGAFENISYLRVPDEHTDHSYYIRYEGPGWESDLVGYRFYLDWRNATDVFGKKTSEMVLQGVGLDGFDSYHEMQDWGMDVLKVGSSLGVGSLGMYFDDQAVRVDKTDSIICEITENGVIKSSILTKYYGWKVGDDTYDVESNISIHAGSRLSHHKIQISGQPDNLCTGVGKDPKAKLYTDQGSDDNWGYLASFGVQSLNNDHLGLAVFFRHKDYKGFTEDEYSNIVKLNVDGGNLDYYFMAIWEGEQNGLTREDEFLSLIQSTAKKLANPIEIKNEN